MMRSTEFVKVIKEKYKQLLCFMLRKDSATKTNTHFQAQPHKPLLQLAKEPNYCHYFLRKMI